MRASWHRRGAARAALPAGVDLSAYRIVQEALTNTLRHARATVAEVTIPLRHPTSRDRRRRRRARLARPRRDGPGHGLIGMRERAACSAARWTPATAHGGYRSPPGCRGRGAVRVRVVIADDQALVRAGFRMILEAGEDIEVVGEAGDGAEAVALVEERGPTSC